MPTHAAQPGPAPAQERFRVRRFDADRDDETLTFDVALEREPSTRQLLWIDILGPLETEEAARLGSRFGLDDATQRSFVEPIDEPHLEIHGAYLHVTVAAEPDARRPRDATWLTVIAATNAVISHHQRPITFLGDFDARVRADTSTGLIDSATFLAALLDGTVTTYFHTVDAIEDDVDRLDSRSLRDSGSRSLLDDLVVVRRRVSELRRLLARHRSLYAALAATGTRGAVEDSPGTDALVAVAARFSSAIAAVESSRDVVLGSFDVYMTRTAQRTNDVMKALTLVTVLLLPGSLIAGLLGMNVSVPLPQDDPRSFWLVVGGVLGLALLIVLVARRRGWL